MRSHKTGARVAEEEFTNIQGRATRDTIDRFGWSDLFYNDFREKLPKPRVKKFEDLTKNREWAEQIREVYDGEVDEVDLQVGLLAETPPKGFGFSDTAFRIFILMASRRLKSDRFFTSDYTPAVYTPEGIQWVERNTMADVLRRHHPELAPALEGVENAFAPWHPVG